MRETSIQDWVLFVLNDLWFFLLIPHSFCACTQHMECLLPPTPTLDVNSSFELIHLHWKPGEWNDYCWGWQLGPSRSPQQWLWLCWFFIISPDQPLIQTVHHKGRALFVPLETQSWSCVWNLALFLAFVGETDSVFPPLDKGEGSPVRNLSCQKSSVPCAQIRGATTHTQKLCE